ncbi:DMT family transporter [Edaphobacter sp. 12200R-103]|jgi:drug/metabolite transporter (DMT)-like permease|uniref:DMT family transporter n=1 Tax=Edaphobacter sp. 12200R-103 TaxID=2703788 RepID=UPI00138B380C|nr:DMT family transporter [Edaphobacter sp. 12200R-103]QHS51137.1 DMT family transporter [Edaphobacter sp. 12200R-103]
MSRAELQRLSPSTIAHLLLLAVVLIWGATFVLIKDALQDVSPLLFNLLRMALAAVALAFINRRHLRAVTRHGLLAGAIVGIFLAAGYQFQTSGLARTTAVKSAFITGTVVVFVPLLTMIPSLRPASAPVPQASSLAGALLAFGGLVLLTTPAATRWGNLFSSIGTGDLLTLLCAIAFAGHLLALAHTSTKIPIPQLATLQIAFAALLMVLTLPLGGTVYLNVTPRLIVALLVTALLATAAAFTIQSWAQQHLPPTHTALLLTLEPVFAWLTSFLFLGERLSARSLTGALLILAGILLTELIPHPHPISEHPSDSVQY